MKAIYLDYAAATPLDGDVLAAMKPYFSEYFYNPSAVYQPARRVKQKLEASRTRVAHWLGVQPGEVVFTAGATEANNLAIHGIMSRYPRANLITTSIEHDAVLKPAQQYKNRFLKVDKDGYVTANSLRTLVTKTTVLISVMYANNEIGTIQPLSEIAREIENIRQARRSSGNRLPLYMHSDAAQAAGYLDLHINRLGVDLMSLNAGKIYGPKQSGALYVRAGIDLEPLIYGGGQEKGWRGGTENLAAAVGLATALDLVQSTRQQEAKRLHHIFTAAEKQLVRELPDVIIHGGRRKLPNNLCFSYRHMDGERAVMELDERGILCATGSACTALVNESSHVIKALGYDEATAAATLRLSGGRQTSEVELKRAIPKIVDVCRRLAGK